MGEPVSAGVLKALAHPSRLAILVALEARDQSAAELAATLSTTEPELASHIATLRTARLVDETAHGLLRTTTGGWAEIGAHLRHLQDGAQEP